MKRSLLLSVIVAVIGIFFIGSYLTGYLVVGNETENITSEMNITPEVTEKPFTKIILNPSFEETRENDLPKNWYHVDYYDKENYDTIPWDKRFYELSDESYSGNKSLVFHNVDLNEFSKVIKSMHIFNSNETLEFSFYFKENMTYDKTDNIDDYAFCFEIITSDKEDIDDMAIYFNNKEIKCDSFSQVRCDLTEIIDIGEWKQARIRISNFNPTGNTLNLYAYDYHFANQGYVIIDDLKFS